MNRWTAWKVFRLIWVIAGIGFITWTWYTYQAKGVGEEVLRSSSTLRVSENADFILFTPTNVFCKVFIFYPGALVDPHAYAPLCRRIADSGYQVYLVKMPWRLAAKGYKKPKEWNLFANSTKQYILSGHSQGAKMAAQFVYENPGLADQLILLGTTHPRDINLSKFGIPVMKITGTKDGIAGVEEVNKNKSKLPVRTKYLLIEGANHAQFGYYGPQLGDGYAGISRTVQQQMVLDSVLVFMKAFDMRRR